MLCQFLQKSCVPEPSRSLWLKTNTRDTRTYKKYENTVIQKAQDFSQQNISAMNSYRMAEVFAGQKFRFSGHTDLGLNDGPFTNWQFNLRQVT